MQLVFIIFGVIIVLSFVTGIILTIREKKKNPNESLTDDPKVLFSDNSTVNSDLVAGSDVSTDTVEIKSEPALEKINDSEGFDLPTNHDYNSHKFVVSSIQEKREIPVVSPPEIEEAPVIENKNTARFIYNEEEII